MADVLAKAWPNALSMFSRFRHVVGKPVPQCTAVALSRERENQITELALHAFLDLDRGTRLGVLRGCVWLTLDGCPEDIVLEDGQTFTNHGGPRVLIHALQPSVVSFSAAAQGVTHR